MLQKGSSFGWWPESFLFLTLPPFLLRSTDIFPSSDAKAFGAIFFSNTCPPECSNDSSYFLQELFLE
jgi:hypothetical protein